MKFVAGNELELLIIRGLGMLESDSFWMLEVKENGLEKTVDDEEIASEAVLLKDRGFSSEPNENLGSSLLLFVSDNKLEKLPWFKFYKINIRQTYIFELWNQSNIYINKDITKLILLKMKSLFVGNNL